MKNPVKFVLVLALYNGSKVYCTIKGEHVEVLLQKSTRVTAVSLTQLTKETPAMAEAPPKTTELIEVIGELAFNPNSVVDPFRAFKGYK